MSTILFEKLKNWKDLKPIRGLIEDFFKVAKDAFGLGEFHSFTGRISREDCSSLLSSEPSVSVS